MAFCFTAGGSDGASRAAPLAPAAGAAPGNGVRDGAGEVPGAGAIPGVVCRVETGVIACAGVTVLLWPLGLVMVTMLVVLLITTVLWML